MATQKKMEKDTRTDTIKHRRAVQAGTVGTAVEFYDYAVYGYFAGSIGRSFFPSDDPVASLLLAFAVFGVGFVMRPLGGVYFGALGDRIGRRNTLVIAIATMSVATLAIGCIPSEGNIGLAAPLLVVLLRLVQGFSAGGEIAGASSFLVEHADHRRRGFTGSFQQVGSGLGLLGGATMAMLLSLVLSHDAIDSYGWRIAFWIAAPLGAITLFIRLRADETPTFQRTAAQGATARYPIIEVWKTHRRSLLLVFLMTVGGTTQYYFFLTYLPTYAIEVLGISASIGYTATVVGLVINVLCTLVVGRLTDQFGRRPILILNAVAAMTLSGPCFLLLSTYRNIGVLLVVQAVCAIIVALWGGTFTAAYAELFKTSVRYTGIGIPYNVAVASFGGTAGFVATALISATGSPVSVVIPVIAGSLVSLLAYLAMRETSRLPLD